MNSAFARLRVLLANLAWLLACLPGWLAFLIASRCVRHVQTALLARILRREASTNFGRGQGFQSIGTPEEYQTLPLTEYEDYRDHIQATAAGRPAILTADPVECLQPTSGSVSTTKLIPLTRTLRNAFKAAVDPWIASLYLAFPSLLLGRHYWSISPSTPHPADPAAKVRIGFADDSEYLGRIQRLLAQVLFAVPAEISRVTDTATFEYLTLLFLCREKNLRLISVWHPSFLTTLIDALPRLLPGIIRDIASGTISEPVRLDPALRAQFSQRLSPHPARARELARLDLAAPDWPQDLWPRLRLLSCWTEGVSEPWLSALAAFFPKAFIQGKGLTATEGIVTFPLGRSGRKVCAVRSHFLEFVEPGTGFVRRAWQVDAGREYSVVLTTGGGLYRYRLHDLVRVTGFFHRTPCLDFIARDNLVSDLVGEKLNARHVEACVHDIEKELGRHFAFAMLAPWMATDQAVYAFYIQPFGAMDNAALHRAGYLMETRLNDNFHYRHARQRSQLGPVRVFRITTDAVEAYRRHLTARGMKAGDIKFQSLSSDCTWTGEFAGAWIEPMSKPRQEVK